jgi:hypothetical protein
MLLYVLLFFAMGSGLDGKTRTQWMWVLIYHTNRLWVWVTPDNSGVDLGSVKPASVDTRCHPYFHKLHVVANHIKRLTRPPPFFELTKLPNIIKLFQHAAPIGMCFPIQFEISTQTPLLKWQLKKRWSLSSSC